MHTSPRLEITGAHPVIVGRRGEYMDVGVSGSEVLIASKAATSKLNDNELVCRSTLGRSVEVVVVRMCILDHWGPSRRVGSISLPVPYC